MSFFAERGIVLRAGYGGLNVSAAHGGHKKGSKQNLDGSSYTLPPLAAAGAPLSALAGNGTTSGGDLLLEAGWGLASSAVGAGTTAKTGGVRSTTRNETCELACKANVYMSWMAVLECSDGLIALLSFWTVRLVHGVLIHS